MGIHQVQESDPADASQPAMSHSLEEGTHSVAVPYTGQGHRVQNSNPCTV